MTDISCFDNLSNISLTGTDQGVCTVLLWEETRVEDENPVRTDDHKPTHVPMLGTEPKPQ